MRDKGVHRGEGDTRKQKYERIERERELIEEKKNTERGRKSKGISDN